MTDDTTNPVDVEDDAVLDTPEVAAESYSDDDTSEAETEGAEDGQPEDELEEVEWDGEKYRIPKALKPGLLMQADYTRKTQELAEQRRTVEQHFTSLTQQAELQQQTLEHRVALRNVEQTLQQLQSIDFSQYDQSDPQVAAWVAQQSMRVVQYSQAKAELESAIAKTETDFQQLSERSRANAIAQADQVLSREIEGWSPQLVRDLAGYAAENFGITPQELQDSVINPDGTADTRTFKVLARLHKAETELAALKAQTTKAQQAAKQAAVTPAKAVGQRAGGYKPGLNDDLPVEEWVRRRNAQRAKARAR